MNNSEKIIWLIILYAIGCLIIYMWQHRGDSRKVESESDKQIKGKISKESILDDNIVASSKNFILVNQLFFTNNFFDFGKFLDFVSNSEEEVGMSDAMQILSLLCLLMGVSSSLLNDFEYQLFFSNRSIVSLKEVKDKISNNEYSGTVADFYEILISLIFHYKKFLIYK